jgi:hypothetical protein
MSTAIEKYRMRGNIYPVGTAGPGRTNVCFAKNSPYYDTKNCQLVRVSGIEEALVRVSGNEEALAIYQQLQTPVMRLPGNKVAPYLRAFIEGNQSFENENFGKFNIMNTFYLQNPNLNKDQWFFQLVEMSAVLLPLAGTLTAFTTLWVNNKFSTLFKTRYINAISQDQRLLDLIFRVTGKRLRNINLGLLKDLASLSQRQVQENGLRMQRINQVNEINARAIAMINNAERRYNEMFAFIELFVKTSAYIAICVKLLLYMIKETAELKLQSVVNDVDFHFYFEKGGNTCQWCFI